MAIDRRTFLRSAAGAAAWPWLAACATWGSAAPADQPFQHGVASGDPLADGFVLWTRATPAAGETGALRVGWQVSLDPDFGVIAADGTAAATPATDYTLKLDLAGLVPATTYYYRFDVGGRRSPTGRTRTLPTGTTGRMRAAFVSCAAFESGYFGAYARVAARTDLDFVLHLGDYLYEYADGVHGFGARLGRAPLPDRECTTLGDYRTRHAQYKTDPDLQALHRQHALIAAWDDHELANNAWRGGAQNHQVEDGDWPTRRAAAMQAYREWLPVREPAPGFGGAVRGAPLYRGFRFGDLVDVSVLDTRSERDAQVYDLTQGAQHADPERSLLGAEQERWLADRTVDSERDGVAWRVLAQQVVFAPTRDRKGHIRNADSWDGYSATRERLYALWQERGLRDNIVLTGDVHSSWALDVPRDPYAAAGYDAASGGDVYAVEFVTPGISSGPAVPAAHRDQATEAALADNPHLRWIDLKERGYGLLDLDGERARCEWYHVDSVEHRDPIERLAAVYEARRGAGLSSGGG